VSATASVDVAGSPAGQRRISNGRIVIAAGGAVALIGVVLYLVAIATHPRHQTLLGFDLNVYLTGGWLARHNPAQLYLWHQANHPGIQFTYTPFAALVFAAAGVVPWQLLMDLMTLASVAALGVTGWIAFRELGWGRTGRAAATLALFGVTLWSEPVQRALQLGQVEILFMAIIVWDLSQPDRRRWKGAATGIAAGIKLVPLLFIVYLVLTRRFRQAATAAAAFAATIVIGWIFLPGPSRSWWIDGLFVQAGRTGFVGDQQNQSLRGTITRLAGSVASGQLPWLIVAVVVTVAGLAAAVVLYRSGRSLAGLMACALTALLISPISWDHHWVWIVGGLAVTIDAAVRSSGRLRVVWLALTVLIVAAFEAWPRPHALLGGGLIGYAPSTSYGYGDNPAFVEYHWYGLELIAGNLYVLAGLGLLAVTVIAAYTVRYCRPS
jgi:alpha-1,2-mannosyltransferase